MNRLEQYIKSNRDAFEMEPQDGHFNRFNEKLENQVRRKKIFMFPQVLKIASVIVLIIISSLWTYEKIFLNKDSEGLSLSDISPEYKEVEQFFVHEVNLKYKQINKTKLFSDSTQKLIVIQELSEMDSIYNSMKKDLKTNPDDERVINAMIEHYQLKLEIMNNILEQLQQINNKQTDHENTEI